MGRSSDEPRRPARSWDETDPEGGLGFEPAGVDLMLRRARPAGGRRAGAQAVGYTRTFADPDEHLWMVETP